MGARRLSSTYSLVADIGGTNTRVALAEGSNVRSETIRRYRNADHVGLEEILTAFLEAEDQAECHAASVAIAGPVRDGRGTLTNLDWTIDEATLARVTRAGSAAVLNDLQAQGHAIGRIAPENLLSVIKGKTASPGASMLVIGVGTGFNVAPVHQVDARRLVVASEAGHESLPVRTGEDLQLARYVEKGHGFAAVEDVLSGRGLERIHAWLGGEDDAQSIMARCAVGGDPRAEQTVATFVRILGTVAGDQALTHLPFGGIFLAGGVARAVAPYLATFGFAESFRDKGRFSAFMEDFDVNVIEDDYAALVGSASHLAHLAPNDIAQPGPSFEIPATP